MASYEITTLGVNVSLKDLGIRDLLIHPVINLDLISLGIREEAIAKSKDLHDALIGGTLSAIYNGTTVVPGETPLDSKLDRNSNLSDLADASIARTNLGLGALATLDGVNGGSA